MRTLIVRNNHQALIEQAFQFKEFGVGGRMPIPMTTVYTNPTERVNLHGTENPFDLLIDSLYHLETFDTFDPYHMEDVDGKIQGVIFENWPNPLSSKEFIPISMYLELHAAEEGKEVGLLYMIEGDPKEENAELIEKLAKCVEEEDPYSKGILSNTIPLVSLPVNRWKRELDSFISGNNGPFIDPFFEHVAKPIREAQSYLATGDLNGAMKCAGDCASQDWMLACQLWIKNNEG